MRYSLVIVIAVALTCFRETHGADEANPEADPLAEDCRRQLNSCLDQAEDRVPGAFDMDSCCDEYKKCMYKIGRNRQ
ncbi:hypothetical protein X975_03593, partial [Stegodyphus mimosarum]